MRSRLHRLLAAALASLGLGACNFGRNVADDCWVDRGALEDANRFRTGLRARNVPPGDGAWPLAEARIDRARKQLRACEDGSRGSGRPDVADLSHGPAAGHGEGGPGAGDHGA